MVSVNQTGWLYTLSEETFAKELQSVLMPSRAIQTPDLLKGRSENLREIRQSLYSVGRQIFIHGYRAVGKTSLAQTAAFQFQSSDNKPILLSCSKNASFFDIIFDMMEEELPRDPRIIKQCLQSKVGAKLSILSSEITKSIEEGQVKKTRHY